MNLNKIGKIQIRKLFILTLVIFSIHLFIFRTVNPFFKFLFVFLYGPVVFYSIFNNFSKIKSSAKQFSRNYLIIIVLSFIILLANILSNKIFVIISKDLLNIFIILSFYFILNLIISSKEEFKYFYNYFVYFNIFFGFFISVYTQVAISNEPLAINELDINNLIDINFVMLSVIFAMVSIIYILTRTTSLIKISLYNILLLFFAISIFSSGSIRAGLTLIIIIIFICLSFCMQVIKKEGILAIIGKKTKLFFLTVILIFGILSLFIFCFSGNFKNNLLVSLGAKDLVNTKKRIISGIRKPLLFIDYYELYGKIWSPYYEPNNPDNGWGTRIHKTVFPLWGKNSEIVPKNTKGYLMDSTCNADSRHGNAFSHTIIGNEIVKKGDVINASVYCYVSKNFNGKWVKLLSEGATIGNTIASYDLNKKGEWQELKISPNCNDGKAPVYLYFAKYDAINFSTLEGYVIFAYPQYKVAKNNSLNEVKSDLLKKSSNENEKNNSPIRSWAAKLFPTDAAYQSYKANLKTDSIPGNFITSRTSRWQFAWLLFTNEYNWYQKIFGDGFNFINIYGYYFLKDKTKSDWPHNPFLSVLLYSGIIGLLLYMLFLYKVFYLYHKYRREYYLLSIFFLITFYFSFFSGGNPFDPPAIGFFIIMPYFIHYTYKKDTKQIKNKELNKSSLKLPED